MKQIYFNLKEGEIDNFIRALNTKRKYEITTMQDLETMFANQEYGISRLSNGSVSIKGVGGHFILPKSELTREFLDALDYAESNMNDIMVCAKHDCLGGDFLKVVMSPNGSVK